MKHFYSIGETNHFDFRWRLEASSGLGGSSRLLGEWVGAAMAETRSLSLLLSSAYSYNKPISVQAHYKTCPYKPLNNRKR
jgi:hypothetical protein